MSSPSNHLIRSSADNVVNGLVVDFDPKTQLRRSCCSSSFAAEILGMHKEELLARIAVHEFPLPFIELDYLRLFLHGLVYDYVAPSPDRDRFIRIRGPGGRGMLICWHTRYAFGPGGFVQQVAGPLHRIPP